MNTSRISERLRALLQMPLRTKRSRMATGALALAAGVVAIYAALGGGGGSSVVVPLATVQRGPLTISVTEAGTVQNRERVGVKNEVEGSTTILYLIAEGTHVKAGDLLVELDSSRLQDQKASQQITLLNAEASFIRTRENLAVTQSQGESDVSQAELNYKFAELDLQKYIEGDNPREIQQADASINIAREELQRAVDKLDWSKKLAAEGYITRTELQADELAAKRAQIELDLAISALDLLDKYTHQRQLAQLESNVEQARMALDRTRRKAAADMVQAQAELTAKESEFERQKAQLDKLNRQIERCRLTAPVDGMVVYATTGQGNMRGNAEPLAEGQSVRERQDLIYLPTTSAMMAEIKIHESSLRKVTRGMPVRVTVDAVPGQVFWGRVGKIGLLPDAQSVWMNPDLKVYTTEIHIDGMADNLRAGMTCQAEIVVERHSDVMYVPVQSVLRVGGQTVTYVQAPAGAQMRPVTIGLDNNRFVHIIDGLQPGEQVLLSPPLAPSAMEQPAIEEAATSMPANIATVPPAGEAPASADAALPDMSRFREMTTEQRREFMDSLTPAQREQLRSRMGGGRRGGDGAESAPRRPRGEGGGEPAGGQGQ